jgi:hypothetical protein
MIRTKLPAALIAVAGSLLLIGAAPADQEIPWPNSSWVIAVPKDSPVRFKGWHEYGYAQFDGRFVLTGEYALTVMELCERPGTEECLVFDVQPDPVIARRLPHLKDGGDAWITVTDEKKRLVETITSPEQRKALLRGKLDSVTGRTSIVVDQFWVGGDCDQVWYSARFVEFAQPRKDARTEFGGGFGCGY